MVPERVFGFCDFSESAELSRRNFFSLSKAAGDSALTLVDDAFAVCALKAQDVYVFNSERLRGALIGEIYQAPAYIRVDNTFSAHDDVSPPQVVSAVYEKKGANGLSELNGVFSCILWDRLEQNLTIFRDGSCAKFLYYCRTGNRSIVFGTAFEDIFALGTAKAISRRSLHEYLRFLDISTPNTIYDGVFSAEPGIPISLSSNPSQQKEPSLKHSKHSAGNAGSREEAADEFLLLLKESISDRMDRTRPTGFFLSGGVDSSLLVSAGVDLASKGLEAFTVGFDGDRYDETKIASSVAAHLGIKHRVLRYSLPTYRKNFSRFLAAADQPFADPAGLPTFLSMEDCASSVETILDGTGADTLVGVMPARYARAATQYSALIPKPVRNFLMRLMNIIPGIRSYVSLLDFEDPQEVLIRWHGWRRSEIERLCGESVSLDHTRFYRVYSSFSRGEHFERYSALLGNLPDDRVHQASRASGVRVRFPFWDPRVVSFVKNLPFDLRFSESETKPILKAALAKLVPRELWDVPKHGFDFPFKEFMAFNGHEILEEYLNPSAIARIGLFDAKLVSECVEAFKGGAEDLSFRVWAFLVFFAWYREHFNG